MAELNRLIGCHVPLQSVLDKNRKHNFIICQFIHLKLNLRSSEWWSFLLHLSRWLKFTVAIYMWIISVYNTVLQKCHRLLMVGVFEYIQEERHTFGINQLTSMILIYNWNVFCVFDVFSKKYWQVDFNNKLNGWIVIKNYILFSQGRFSYNVCM